MTADSTPKEQTKGGSSQRHNLFGACLAHLLHDGYTDQLYALLPVWQGEFGLSYAGLAVVRALYSGTIGGLQIPADKVAARVSPRASAEFYRRVFDLGTLLESDRLIALDAAGRSVLLLFQAGATGEPFATPGGTIPGHPGHGPTHFAFAIAMADVEAWERRLAERNVPIESVVTWPGGAMSIYVRDPDANLVELITPGFWASY